MRLCPRAALLCLAQLSLLSVLSPERLLRGLWATAQAVFGPCQNHGLVGLLNHEAKNKTKNRPTVIRILVWLGRRAIFGRGSHLSPVARVARKASCLSPVRARAEASDEP